MFDAQYLWELLEDGQVEEALQLIDDALELSPDESGLLALRALLLVDLDRRDEAAAAARRARDVDPDNSFAHFALGEVALAQGEVQHAIAAAQAAQHLDPDYVEAALLEARARARAGHWPRVQQIAQRIVSEHPDQEGASVLLALASEMPMEAPLSAERWDALAGRFPLNAFARAGRAWTQLQTGDARAAETEFRQALTLAPGLEWARAGLVTALKARNPVYRMLLLLCVRLSRLPRRTQNMLLIGGVIGYNMLRRAARENPELNHSWFRC
ncbi:MAG: tetratricopeptide repeat protein [Longimicrobiales bacterium]